MAKRIIISFTDNPITGIGFVYTMLLDSVPLLYDNGYTTLSLEYLENGIQDSPPLQVEKQTTLENTINKTLSFLNENWSADFVYYARVDNDIHVIFEVENLTYAPGSINGNINLSLDTINEIEYLNLKYYFQYTNVVEDNFLCRIFKKRYIGDALEVNGNATLEKGSVKNHTDGIRGTGLSIKLEASLELTLEDLYTENEQDFIVKFYKNNKLIFSGFLKPDGIFQSFVKDYWILSLDCVDGLGALSNLSFVQENGFRFTGKMKPIDIIYYCLKRTGILLPINTSINTLYDGLIDSQSLNVLDKIYLNSDRFFKQDSQGSGDGTLMSCEEVLKSVLDIFSACITQENGEWYIYKATEIYLLPYVLFKRYDVNNIYYGNVTINLNKEIGSQIDNYYPHHSGGNQKIEIQGAISAFRLGYKYGFVNGVLINPSFLSNGNLIYNGWIIENSTNLIYDPLKKDSLIIKNKPLGDLSSIVKSVSVLLPQNTFLKIKISFAVTDQNGNLSGRYIYLKIKNGNKYLRYIPVNESTPLDDTSRAFWTDDSTSPYIVYLNKETSYEIAIPPLPLTDNTSIELVTVYPENGITEIKSLDLIPNTGENPEIGEFHTVARKVKVSSIVKENRSVSNGDNENIIYSGAIFKEDQITPTNSWSRKGSFESYPLLRIAAEEELRLGQKPLKIFSGNLFGYLPYLSFININNINGKFMPIEYSYDTAKNEIKLKLLELYAEEIGDINYKFSFDYGNTVKPTITS